MATHHGRNGTVRVGSNTVAEIKSFSLDQTADTIEDTAMGDSMKSYKVGQGDASGSITCHFDETDTSGQGAMTAGAEVSLTLAPEGMDSGDTIFTMTAIINSVGMSVDMGDVVERTFGFQVTAGVTQTTA